MPLYAGFTPLDDAGARRVPARIESALSPERTFRYWHLRHAAVAASPQPTLHSEWRLLCPGGSGARAGAALRQHRQRKALLVSAARDEHELPERAARKHCDAAGA